MWALSFINYYLLASSWSVWHSELTDLNSLLSKLEELKNLKKVELDGLNLSEA